MIPAGCKPNAAVCCDAYYAVAESLAEIAFEALVKCVAPSCEGMQVFVSHGPPVGTGNFISAWHVSTVFPGSDDQRERFISRAVGTYTVRLMESGYPTIRNAPSGGFTLPQRDEIDAIAQHSYGHGEQVLRAIVNAKAAGRTPLKRCSSVALVSYVPLRISAGYSGHDITVALDLPWQR